MMLVWEETNSTNDKDFVLFAKYSIVGPQVYVPSLSMSREGVVAGLRKPDKSLEGWKVLGVASQCYDRYAFPTDGHWAFLRDPDDTVRDNVYTLISRGASFFWYPRNPTCDADFLPASKGDFWYPVPPVPEYPRKDVTVVPALPKRFTSDVSLEKANKAVRKLEKHLAYISDSDAYDLFYAIDELKRKRGL